MIIGMRGHDFGRMEPRALALAIREAGFEATQLAFAKAFPAPAEQYMIPGALSEIRSAFAGIVLPVMGCYVSASDRDPDVLAEAKARFKRSLSASVILGAGCVGTETTHFTFPESEREAAYARLLDFTREVCAHAGQVHALVGIEPVAHAGTRPPPDCRCQQSQSARHPRYGEPRHARNRRARSADGDFGACAFLLRQTDLRAARERRRV